MGHHLWAVALALSAAVLGCRSTGSTVGGQPPPRVGVTFLGKVSWPTSPRFAETDVGGLSSITWDRQRGVYYALSDDRGDRQPSRFYTLAIDLGDDRLDSEDIRVTAVHTLRDATGAVFGPRVLDPEGLAVGGDGRLFLSSEGAAASGIAPFVREFERDGRERRGLELPAHLLPDGSGGRGVRDNLALEALAVSPDGRWLFVGSENALAQDGPEATPDVASPSRLLRYDLARGRWAGEFLYWTEPVAGRPSADGLANNGLVELLALDDHRLLALERSYAEGWGLSIRLFQVSLTGADDIASRDALAGLTATIRPVRKHLVAHLERFAGTLDNIEGMTFGPPLADGRRLLLLVGDNNFSATQQTQFLAFALRGLD